MTSPVFTSLPTSNHQLMPFHHNLETHLDISSDSHGNIPPIRIRPALEQLIEEEEILFGSPGLHFPWRSLKLDGLGRFNVSGVIGGGVFWFDGSLGGFGRGGFGCARHLDRSRVDDECSVSCVESFLGCSCWFVGVVW